MYDFMFAALGWLSMDLVLNQISKKITGNGS